MTRTDVYVVAGIAAWIAGAYWIGDGLRAQAEATDRQVLATYCASDPIASRMNEQDWETTCMVALEVHSLKRIK